MPTWRSTSLAIPGTNKAPTPMAASSSFTSGRRSFASSSFFSPLAAGHGLPSSPLLRVPKLAVNASPRAPLLSWLTGGSTALTLTGSTPRMPMRRST
ncbi:hypothetical protein BN1723_020534, partial [Verticillium longisporum]